MTLILYRGVPVWADKRVTEPLTIRLNIEAMAALENLAKQQGRKKSDIARRFIEQGIARATTPTSC